MLEWRDGVPHESALRVERTIDLRWALRGPGDTAGNDHRVSLGKPRHRFPRHRQGSRGHQGQRSFNRTGFDNGNLQDARPRPDEFDQSRVDRLTKRDRGIVEQFEHRRRHRHPAPRLIEVRSGAADLHLGPVAGERSVGDGDLRQLPQRPDDRLQFDEGCDRGPPTCAPSPLVGNATLAFANSIHRPRSAAHASSRTASPRPPPFSLGASSDGRSLGPFAESDVAMRWVIVPHCEGIGNAGDSPYPSVSRQSPP